MKRRRGGVSLFCQVFVFSDARPFVHSLCRVFVFDALFCFPGFFFSVSLFSRILFLHPLMTFMPAFSCLLPAAWVHVLSISRSLVGLVTLVLVCMSVQVRFHSSFFSSISAQFRRFLRYISIDQINSSKSLVQNYSYHSYFAFYVVRC
ncbi:hypothetical protein DFP72DRAFT_901439 [Ephemerocybe angulata]|uniref:Transmembrane protein n=1 Tax=Ephemerocybe angulata TaxID=980116 RepID=A0A8H6HVQ9_9AGAR|nr:hypothetical protein DFP72DRAFT_901439 [Tulosesus angulatus]